MALSSGWISRRTFLKMVSGLVVLFQVRLALPVESLANQASLLGRAYGSGSYGEGSYAPYVIFLPSITNKGAKNG